MQTRSMLWTGTRMVDWWLLGVKIGRWSCGLTDVFILGYVLYDYSSFDLFNKRYIWESQGSIAGNAYLNPGSKTDIQWFAVISVTATKKYRFSIISTSTSTHSSINASEYPIKYAVKRMLFEKQDKASHLRADQPKSHRIPTLTCQGSQSQEAAIHCVWRCGSTCQDKSISRQAL